MLNITHKEFHPKLSQPYNLSNISVSRLDTVVIKIGKGFGEATTLKHYSDETLDSIKSVFSKLKAPEVENTDDIREIMSSKIFSGHNFARSAVECALFDHLARQDKSDFASLIGKQKRDNIGLVGNIGIHPMEETMQKALHFISKGFTTIKLKIGKHVKKDITMAKEFCDRFPDINVRLDANQGYNYEDTLSLFKALAGKPIELIEQPMPKGHLENYAKLKKEVSLPIMLDEEIYSSKTVGQAIRLKACDKVKSKLFKTGILDTIRIAELCRDNDVDFIWGNGVQTQLGSFAEIKIASVIDEINPVCECIGPLKLAENITDKDFRVHKGKIEVEPAIGLGLNVYSL